MILAMGNPRYLNLKFMKKSLFIIAIAAMIGAMGCEGEYVDEQPADVTYEQGVAPGPDYVWIDGDWVYSGGRYSYQKGHWDHRREGHTYAKGSWSHTSHGYHWNKGHWN
jgi:WXXGXW repeat (2 copies)